MNSNKNCNDNSCKRIGKISSCNIVYILSALILLLMAISCNEDKKHIPDNFIDTYEDVLIARERYDYDSVMAQRKVDSVMKFHGYDEPTFRQDYFHYATEYKEEFIRVIDSLRDFTKEKYDSLKKIQDELRIE